MCWCVYESKREEETEGEKEREKERDQKHNEKLLKLIHLLVSNIQENGFKDGGETVAVKENNQS